MRTLNYGDTLIGQTLSLDFSSLKFDGNLKPTIIAKSKNGSMIRCHTETNANFITIQDGSNSTVLYKRTSGEDASISLTEYACNSFDDIVYLNTDIFGYSCIKVDESANHKPLRINIDDINMYSGKYITATTCEGTSPIRRLNGYTRQEIREESKSTVTGTEVTVNDTYVNNQTEFTIDGNRYQETTEGYNLYNIDEALNDVLKKNDDNSYTFTRTSSRFAKAVNISIPANTDFVIDYSNMKVNGNYEGPILSAVIKYTDDTDNTSILYSTEEDRRQVRRYSKDIKSIQLYLESSLPEGTGITFSDFMIYLGSNLSKTYEPYTGGMPSPNPDYIQKITSVGEYDNLFDKNNIISGSYVSDGKGTFVSNSTSKRTDYIEIQASSYYYIYSDKLSGNWGAWYDKDKNFISGITLGGKNEGTVNSPANAKYIAFTISYQGNLTDYSKIKINETAIKIKHSGKNLFNFNGVTNPSIATYESGIATLTWDRGYNVYFLSNSRQKLTDIDSKKTYTVIFKHKGNSIKMFNYATSQYGVSTKDDNEYAEYKFIITGVDFIELNAIRIATSGTAYIKEIMLYEGTDEASYEPYHEPIITPINLQGNVLSKAGDVKDILKIRKNGRVTITKTIGKVILDGTEKLSLSGATTDEILVVALDISGAEDGYGYSNYFVYSSTVKQNSITVYNNGKSLRFCVNKNEFFNLEAFKAWVKSKYDEGNPVLVYYKLATPQIITLPSISPIELWQGTNIFSLVTNLDTEIELEYNYLPKSPSPEAPSEIKNMGDNINIFNKNATMYSNGIVKEELETGVRIKQTIAGTSKYGWIELGKSELLGKTITIQAKKAHSAENKPGIKFYYGNETSATHTVTPWSLDSLNTLTFTLPSSYPDECDRLFLILYSNTNGTGNAGDYVDYTDLKIAVKNSITPYSNYNCGSTKIKSQNTNLVDLEELMKISSEYQKIDNGYIFSANNVMYLTGMTLDTPIALPASMSYTIKNGTGTNFRFKFVYDNGSVSIFKNYVSGTEANVTKDIVINNITKSGASKIVKICIDFTTAGTFTLTNFMINEGTTVKPYIKHQESYKVLEFNKLLYQNCYLAEDGIHYTKKQIQLDGITYGLRVESVTLSNTSNLYYCVIEIPKYPGVAGINNMYSTHFTPYNGVKVGSCYITNYGKYIVIVLTDQTLKTKDAVNMWLNGLYANKTPVTIEYELAKEIIEPYTDTPPIFIDQFENQTTVSTSDESEIEIEMTSNESLANIQKEIKNLYDKSKVYNSDTPIGTIVEWGSYAAPEGWLLCNGQAVSRMNYSELFDVIGTFFGSGDDSTTFNLPDKQGRFGYGATSTNESDDYSLGKTGRRSYT